MALCVYYWYKKQYLLVVIVSKCASYFILNLPVCHTTTHPCISAVVTILNTTVLRSSSGARQPLDYFSRQERMLQIICRFLPVPTDSTMVKLDYSIVPFLKVIRDRINLSDPNSFYHLFERAGTHCVLYPFRCFCLSMISGILQVSFHPIGIVRFKKRSYLRQSSTPARYYIPVEILLSYYMEVLVGWGGTLLPQSRTFSQ